MTGTENKHIQSLNKKNHKEGMTWVANINERAIQNGYKRKR